MLRVISVNSGDRSPPPLQFNPPAGFASYCRTLWSSPNVTASPRYIPHFAQAPEENIPRKSGR